MMLTKMNRKGQRAMVIGVAIVILVLIMIIFSIIFSKHGEKLEENIQGSFSSTTHKMALLNFLRMPVQVDGTKMLMADVCALYAETGEGKYKDIIDNNSERILRVRNVKAPGEQAEDTLKYVVFVEKDKDPSNDYTFCTEIPSLDPSKTIRVCMRPRDYMTSTGSVHGGGPMPAQSVVP